MLVAAALLVVLGSALAMQLSGLSMAMGAFLAGVLLSESSFRHQLDVYLPETPADEGKNRASGGGDGDSDGDGDGECGVWLSGVVRLLELPSFAEICEAVKEALKESLNVPLSVPLSVPLKETLREPLKEAVKEASKKFREEVEVSNNLF